MTATRTPIGRDTQHLDGTDQERLGRTAPIRVLGLDLSLTRTGWALDGRHGVIPCGSRTGPERIDWILRQVLDLAGEAEIVAMEGYSFGSRGRAVFQIAELGGLIRWAFWRRNIRWAEIPPAVVKKLATGKGNAGKEEVLAAAIRRLGYSGHDNNEADALWLEQAALIHYGDPIAASMPQANREALEKVTWPKLATLGKGEAR